MSDHTAGILRLALPVSLRRLFDYLPPSNVQTESLKPGMRVRVPFGRGNRDIIGILISRETTTDVPADKLRYAKEIIDQSPLLSAPQLKLITWTANYYHYPLGDTLTQALPALLRQGYDLAKEVHSYWQPSQQCHSQTEQTLARAPRQLELWQVIKRHSDGISVDALRSMGFDTALIRNLEKRGLIQQFERAPTYTLFHDHRPLLKSAPLVLNAEQERALAAITEQQQFATTLLHGVTGSGKTEVYLQAIAHTLSQNKQALVLIPEIGLTPQTLARFEERFNVPIVVLHSGLNDRERLNGWLSARRGEAGIVISTRSGIFTPLYAPGIIIVDEEHDMSYKQQDSIRYSARDLAIYRGHLEQIPVVLGSATPSLETLHNSLAEHSSGPRYHYQPLLCRAGGATPPTLLLVNTRQQPLQGGLPPESLSAIRQTLNDGHQVLVFLNRRGYAPTVVCDNCGWLIDCPNCDSHLTLHRMPLHLHCHHCDYQQGIPNVCPHCQSPELSPVGQGTERTEEILDNLFGQGARRPHKPVDVLRIDRDSMRKKHAFEEMMHKVHQGQPMILIGTQMLAKGHHFPNVTLVVIVNADAGFFSADFRGPEKTGQLILQVAGRAGRANNPGRVLIQTNNPEHPQLRMLVQQGYDPFAEALLRERQHIGLPPFSYLALITAEASSSQPLIEFLQEVTGFAQELVAVNQFEGPDGIQLLGPMPAPMEKRQGRMRWQLRLQAGERKPLHNLLSRLLPFMDMHPLARRLRWSIDIDPQDMS